MKLSSSLIEILGKIEVLFAHEEEALTDIIKGIEAILSRLKLWFRRKYEDLSRKKDVTEEQGVAEPIFEFPNNVRHTCTTMPWTIFPSLLVLWGVCWMFIVGSSQPEHEWVNAADPVISPLAAYDFYADFYGIGIEEGPQGSVADSSDNRPYVNQDTLEELFPGDGQSMSDLIHPLTFVGDTPLDPNFLVTDMTSHSDSGNLELAAQDTAEILPAAVMEDSTLSACISAGDSGERDDTGSGYGHRTINSDDRAGETKSRFVCPDCQRTFARPFTLSRHRTEKHNHPSSLEAALLCSNRGCKRSKGKPFKREFHLKRHLESCNHSQEDLGQGDDQSCTRPASTSTSTSASIHHRQEVGPDTDIRANGMKRRRVEDDEGLNDEFLLAEMVKKYRKIEKEIEEKKKEIEEKEKENLQKQDDLKALGKTIQMLERS
ncbi:uncharacterized protein FFB14_04832 [Fusarium fujikuroi]|nr:uncharacterized protein FFB14_04832 [Fusarium fujikuroi]